MPQLLEKHRRVRNPRQLPSLSLDEILRWADAHHRRTGRWPKQNSGPIDATGETWGGVNSALASGTRGLHRKSTLAAVLQTHRGVRNARALPGLTVNQILLWADRHKHRTGKWPSQRSGPIVGTDENWAAIDAALGRGSRGLKSGGSLAKLLCEQRGRRHKRNLATLSEQQILKWADAYKAENGHWPSRKSGPIGGTTETWSGVDGAMKAGKRGFEPRSSLAGLLDRERGVPNKKRLPPLTVARILVWAEEHRKATGSFPNTRSGKVGRTQESWARVNVALLRGYRGLPGGLSLATLLTRQRTPQRRSRRP